MAGGGNSCAVVGCINRTVADKNVHFYHFPTKDPALREVWKTFSRRGSDYKIRQNTVICHEHFDPSCYDVKAKQMRIKTGSIPTIFYRSREKIILTFDRDLMHYVEEETLLNPVYDREKREMELIAKRERKVEVHIFKSGLSHEINNDFSRKLENFVAFALSIMTTVNLSASQS